VNILSVRGAGLHSQTGVSAATPPPIETIDVIASTSLKESAGASIDKPTGTEEHDLMVLFVVRRANNTVPNPGGGGWTLIESRTGIAAGDTRIWLYEKTAGDSEPSSYSIAAGGHWAASIVTLRGAAIAEYDIEDGMTANGGTAATLPALLLVFWANASGTTTEMTEPESMTQLEEVGDVSVRLTVAYEDLESTGATGTRTATGGGTNAKSTSFIIEAP
jgi:hypothetical protein